MVERAFILPPGTRIGPLTPAERAPILQASVVKGVYETPVDRESAYEKLKARAGAKATIENDRERSGTIGNADSTEKTERGNALNDLLFGSTGPRGGHREGMLESAAKSAARSVGSGLGRSILRGMLGSILGGKR